MRDSRTGLADLSLLRHFVAVVQAGSFTRASRQLNLSQSVVSRSVSRLEDTLGVRLLERTTRKLRLAPAGEALFAEATASLDRIAVAIDDARRIGQGENAVLRIGICQSVAADVAIMQRGLQAFRMMWPQVELKMCAMISALQGDALRASELDVGVLQLDPLFRDGLAWRILTRSPLMVAIPAIWGLKADRVRLWDLRERPWILPDPELSDAGHDGMLGILRAAGFEPKVGGLADDRLTAQIMLGCGVGAALVHARQAADPAVGFDLVPLAPPDLASHAETIVSWAPGSTSEQIASLVGCLADAAAQGDRPAC